MADLDKSNGEEATTSMTAVQRQLAEYRKRMSAKRNSPNNTSAQDSEAREQLLTTVTPRDTANLKKPKDELLLNISSDVRQENRNSDLAFNQEGNFSTFPVAAGTKSTDQVYFPPQLVHENLNATYSESKEDTKLRASQLLLTNESRVGSIVSITQIPILNIFDLTRASQNMRYIR